MQFPNLLSTAVLLAAIASFAKVATLLLGPDGTPDLWQRKGEERDITMDKAQPQCGTYSGHTTYLVL